MNAPITALAITLAAFSSGAAAYPGQAEDEALIGPGYVMAACYERDDPETCIRERADEVRRELLCTGPTEVIADDDPGLALFADSDESLADRKVRLAIERVNSCDREEPDCE